jgi:hypothetical protein
MGEWRYSSSIFDIGTRRRCVQKLGGPQRQSGCFGEEKNLSSAGNRTKVVQPVARRSTDRGELYNLTFLRSWIRKRHFCDLQNTFLTMITIKIYSLPSRSQCFCYRQRNGERNGLGFDRRT